MSEMFKKDTSIKELYDNEKVKEIERLKAENEELRKQVGKKPGSVSDDDFMKGFNSNR
ncbi:hypothetical protein [Isachenkonia alkalipeptolytica]|uniref:hypothetical protein n=1 Tax=Isachenkonia alkalipeptolytica TaxID=2565777 RepID=UPI001369B305|nr:hypothetical protein [Isachenkonia alkalipeptolytica]